MPASARPTRSCTACGDASARSCLPLGAQLARPLLQVAEVLRAGDLGYLARPLRFIHLDAQLAYLALQPFLAGPDLARHLLKDARQLAQRV